MRILYDHQVFSLQTAGGASRYYFELLKALAGTSGVQTEVWLGISRHDTAFQIRAMSSTQMRVMNWNARLGHGKARYLANEVLGNAVAPFAGRMDVYHPTLYRAMPLVRTRRVVATHHDCVHERFPELFANAHRIIRAKGRLYDRADAIICVSESSRNDLLHFYRVSPSKTRVIHHGLRRLCGSRTASIQLRGRVPAEFLLFVGSRAPYKNFNALLRAFRATSLDRSMHLVVVGGGTLTAEERSLAQQLEITSRLVVFPEISDTGLAEVYARARLLVYPSLCEGFGFPPLEAMAADCPALVSNVSSLPEICRDAAFYFNPGTNGDDRSSFERSLLQAVTDEPARRHARERGAVVVASYSWERCARETLALYRECQ